MVKNGEEIAIVQSGMREFCKPHYLPITLSFSCVLQLLSNKQVSDYLFHQRGEAKLLLEDWEEAVEDLKQAAQSY